MNNKEFKLIKNGYIFEYDDNFGHINVDCEETGECEDCIEIGMGIVFPDQQSFEAKCNEWLRKKRQELITPIFFLDILEITVNFLRLSLK